MKQGNTSMLSFGQRFKYLRQRAGLTQKEVAARLGYETHTSIFKIESGKQELPITMVPAVCKALQCTPFELLGLRPEGDILIRMDPETETLMERVNRLPAAKRHQLEKTMDIFLKGMEGTEDNGDTDLDR